MRLSELGTVCFKGKKKIIAINNEEKSGIKSIKSCRILCKLVKQLEKGTPNGQPSTI